MIADFVSPAAYGLRNFRKTPDILSALEKSRCGPVLAERFEELGRAFAGTVIKRDRDCLSPGIPPPDRRPKQP